ncbi:MAG TPA: hypothetical protein VFF69_16460 [Phycisphaerales bacterium]|nr:hypothetical protein [Phycisphaerales bacterium]
MLDALRATLDHFLLLLHSAHLTAALALAQDNYACVMLTFTRADIQPTDYALLLSCPPGCAESGPWSLVAINLDTS